jgi:hypothetical protein
MNPFGQDHTGGNRKAPLPEFSAGIVTVGFVCPIQQLGQYPIKQKTQGF